MPRYGLKQERAGTIRRVVRRGSMFFCGLCRRSHSDEEEAHNCVLTCWEDVLALDPVIVRRSAISLEYRCRFCARDYRQSAQARRCSETCRKKHMDAFQAEELQPLADDGGDRPSRYRPRSKLQLVAPRPLPPRSAQPVLVAPAEPPPLPVPQAAAAPAAPAKPAEASAPAPVKTAAEAAPPAADEKGLRDSEMFSRDGARYICKVCKKKHFTRDDVVHCFDSHSVGGDGAPG